REAPPGDSPQTARPGDLDIRFDLAVVDRFLQFVDRGAAPREELESWARLPGNRELLRQGRLEGGLNADILQEAARVTLAGGVFSGPPTLGRLDGGDWGTLRAITAALHAGEPALRTRVSRALAPYLPEGGVLPPLTVQFHLGGSWDGRTTDAVYINLTYFQRRGASSLPGIEALLVHEVFHLAQAALLPGVEDYGSPQSALFTLMLRLEQEGIARHLEVGALRAQGAHVSLDATNLATYEDGLRRAPEHARLLQEFLAAIDARRMEEARRIAAQGFLAGGPFYAVGEAVAEAIETGSGRAALAATIPGGPLAFARAYAVATGGRAPLFPEGLAPALAAVDSGYGQDPLRASRRRREGLKLLMEDRTKDAVPVLEEAESIDPSDYASAYNLACAWSILGKEKRALRWLRRSFDRGFVDFKHAATDPDLEALRRLDGFAALLRERGFDYRRLAAPASTP
ncbi:MAG TPA: DUF5700 domain-containing putative Zn-dependent protease, partial [Dongiaceae bacterium]|nr:DUF5700 domain-containing putative Zn-dependent protease [Dongiaceae bacterium]